MTSHRVQGLFSGAIVALSLPLMSSCGLLIVLSPTRGRIDEFTVVEPQDDQVVEGEIPLLVDFTTVRARPAGVRALVDGQEVARGEVGEAFSWLPTGERRAIILEIAAAAREEGSGTALSATDVRTVNWRPSFALHAEVCLADAACQTLSAGERLIVQSHGTVTPIPQDTADSIVSATATLNGVPLSADDTFTFDLPLAPLPDGDATLIVTAERKDGQTSHVQIVLDRQVCALPDHVPLADPPVRGAGGIAFDDDGVAFIAGVRDGLATVDRVLSPPHDSVSKDWLTASSGAFGPVTAAAGTVHVLWTPPTGDPQIWRVSDLGDATARPITVATHKSAFDVVSMPDGSAVYATIDEEHPGRARLWHAALDGSVVDVTPTRRRPGLPLTLAWGEQDRVVYAEDGFWRASVFVDVDPIDATISELFHPVTGVAPYGDTDGWFLALDAGGLREVNEPRFWVRSGNDVDWLDHNTTGGGRAQLAQSTRNRGCRIVYAATADGVVALTPEP